MTNIQALIDKCDHVVAKWAERNSTIETVQDFAAVFGLMINFQLVPLDEEPQPEPVKEDPVSYPDLELTPDDRSMLGSWRERNGLNNGR